MIASNNSRWSWVFWIKLIIQSLNIENDSHLLDLLTTARKPHKEPDIKREMCIPKYKVDIGLIILHETLQGQNGKAFVIIVTSWVRIPLPEK